MFESSDDSEEESAPKPTLGEMLGRLRDQREQKNQERLHREAREWDKQQRINPVPNPLLMPVAGEQSPKESSPDTVISSM